MEKKEQEPGSEKGSVESTRFFKVGGFDEAARKATLDKVVGQSDGEVETSEGQEKPDCNASDDFHLAFSVASDSILASCIVEQAEGNDEGSFLCFVTPPAADPDTNFTRDIIFVMDRSGSMVGEPYQEAVKALSVGLKKLNKGEFFNVIVFDHKLEMYQPSLVEATEDNVFQAIMWASIHQPRRGGTNTSSAIDRALDHLEKSRETRIGAIQFAVIITDGCVKKYFADHLAVTPATARRANMASEKHAYCILKNVEKII